MPLVVAGLAQVRVGFHVFAMCRRESSELQRGLDIIRQIWNGSSESRVQSVSLVKRDPLQVFLVRTTGIFCELGTFASIKRVFFCEQMSKKLNATKERAEWISLISVSLIYIFHKVRLTTLTMNQNVNITDCKQFENSEKRLI